MKSQRFGGQLEAILQLNQTSVQDLIEEENHSTAEGNTSRLRQIQISKLRSGIYQPRLDFDDESLSELKLSIAQHGILQPLIVRKKEDYYEIVAGERRWRAAKQAGLIEVPAIIRDITDETTLAFGLIENIQRQKLNAIEEARALQRLVDEFQITHEQVAKLVSKSRTSITNALRLLSLSACVQELVIQKKIEMGHARALLSLKESEQIQTANIVVKKSLSVRETERLVKNILSGKKQNQQEKDSNEYSELLEGWYKRLPEKVEMKISIKPNGQGRAVINFSKPEELEWIISKIE